MYLYAKNPCQAKYQFLINKLESTGLKHLNDSKAYVECSDNMNDIYKNVEEYNPNKKRKIIIFFDNIIADILVIKNLIQQGKKAEHFSCFLIRNLNLLFQKILD